SRRARLTNADAEPYSVSVISVCTSGSGTTNGTGPGFVRTAWPPFAVNWILMFHPKVVQATLARWAAKPGNFEPEYHSAIDVERIVAHFNALVELDQDGQLVSLRAPGKDWRETLESEEIRLIRNEMILCRADFSYFVSRYAWIKSDEDRVVRMNPWV